MKVHKNISGLQYFLLGLLVFLILGMDMFAMFLDQWMWGDLFNVDDYFASPWYVIVVHWCIVIVLWAEGAIAFWVWLKKSQRSKDVISLKWSSGVIPLMIIAFLMSFLFALLEPTTCIDAACR